MQKVIYLTPSVSNEENFEEQFREHEKNFEDRIETIKIRSKNRRWFLIILLILAFISLIVEMAALSFVITQQSIINELKSN